MKQNLTSESFGFSFVDSTKYIGINHRPTSEIPVYKPLPKKIITLNIAKQHDEALTVGLGEKGVNSAVLFAQENWFKLKGQIQAYIAPPKWASQSRHQIKELIKFTQIIHTGWKKIMEEKKSAFYKTSKFPYLSLKTATIINTKSDSSPIQRSSSLIDFKEFYEYQKSYTDFKEYSRENGTVNRNPIFSRVRSNSYNCLSSFGKNPRLRRRIKKIVYQADVDSFPANEDMCVDDYESDKSSELLDDNYSDVDEKVY